ncbi:MAG: hypothetical protein KAT15_25035, partial [Bacteroidales bacterium]|nr:hypothetical protein [Bacteroidales bacterium]
GMRAYYYHKKEHFESLPDTENEIIFLGNSITDNCEWAELFGNPNIKNRGIGGDDTDGILERLEEVTASDPSKIFILIGTNDLAYGTSPDHVVENIGQIIDRIQADSPNTIIYIQGVLPVDDAVHYTRKNGDIIRINRELKKLENDRGIVYIDLHSEFLNEDGILDTEYSIDGLHLNGKGYQLWKELISKHVSE